MTDYLSTLSVTELTEKLNQQAIWATDLVTEAFDRMDRLEPTVQAFISTDRTGALARAAAIDRQRQAGETVPPMAGIPIAIKDNICVAGTRTTCASAMLAAFVSPYDATVITALKQAGLIILGKTNLDEFAMGSTTEHSAFFPTRNPWNPDYVPGGSSGGSAAAVSASFSPLALGSDTGGSVRQPAAFCGVCGLKPTYGRVSRYGLVAFGSSLDQIGVFGHSAPDCGALLNLIAGHDPKDSTSAKSAVPDFTDLSTAATWKIGVPTQLYGEHLDPVVAQCLESALQTFRENGHTVSMISLTGIDYSLSTYYILAPAEASANLARFDGVRYGSRAPDTSSLKDLIAKSRGQGFGAEVKRRILLGTHVLSSGYYDAYYLKAQKARTYIKQAFEAQFKHVDVIITPTSPVPPFKLGESLDPLTMYQADIATLPINLAGLPAMSIPCGWTEDNLPIGLQIVGRAWDEQTILKVAHTYQQLTAFHSRRPVVRGGQDT